MYQSVNLIRNVVQTNKLTYCFGKSEENMDMSRIYLAVHANTYNEQLEMYFHDIFILLILYNKAKKVVRRRSKNLEGSNHPRPLEEECFASILANIWLLGGLHYPPPPPSTLGPTAL